MASEYSCRSTRTERRTRVSAFTLLQQHQHYNPDRTQQVQNNNDCFQHSSVSCSATDRTEFIRIQRGATYEPPIDIPHAEQLGSTGGLHTATIKNSQPTRDTSIELRNLRADRCMHFLSLLGRSGQPGANGPYRLIGNYGVLQRIDTQRVDHRGQLATHHTQRCIRFTLLAGFTNAEHRSQTCSLYRRKLAHDHFVTFTQNQATLRVANQHQLTTAVEQLTNRQFTSQGTLLYLCCTILRSNHHRFTIQAFDDLSDMQTGGKHRNIDISRK
ncbi:hypothetical protein BHQ29_03800 [Pseudomonas sp. LPH1]|nr:hypothetical protein BHQ29_03800 [Pseudomonas sp. LPH1]